VAGYRDFQTGEVLTAANVNQFLMEQATMTFADDAARTAALAGVLREGLLTYNLDTNRLEVYDGSAWVEPAPEPPAGIGSNVVSALKTDTFSTNSATYVLVTDLEVTITPTSSDSRIAIFWTVPFGVPSSNANQVGNVTIFKNDTNFVVPDSPGSRTASITAANPNGQFGSSLFMSSGLLIDSPNTTSPVTYDVRVLRVTGGAITVNSTQGDATDGAVSPRSVASITVMEVAG
jgi:hypothetical protein